ncbi:hypothetical protein HZC30_02160 [Candidatus Woesearchaeota archaeon]|nr:hypothetical protein [Candidatus Woesearchaeota archaeon]
MAIESAKEINVPPNQHLFLLQFISRVNPIDWDMNYEDCYSFILAFIFGNKKLLETLPPTDLFVPGYGQIKSWTFLKRAGNPFFGIRPNLHFIVRFDNGEDVALEGLRRWRQVLPRDADILGTFFNCFQKHYPEKTYKYELNVFKKMSKKGIGLQYVGKTPLRAHSFGIIVNGKWLKGAKAKAYLGTQIIKFSSN